MENQHKRQGDLLFIKVQSIPKEAKRVKSQILAYGETTGHKHELVGAPVFATGTNLYFPVQDGGEEVKVVHEEHRTEKFESGFWMLRRQRQWEGDRSQRVKD